jgi:hypothetical protein
VGEILHCATCGKELPEEAKFCLECGAATAPVPANPPLSRRELWLGRPSPPPDTPRKARLAPAPRSRRREGIEPLWYPPNGAGPKKASHASAWTVGIVVGIALFGVVLGVALVPKGTPHQSTTTAPAAATPLALQASALVPTLPTIGPDTGIVYPTPVSYLLRGSITAPDCASGYNLDGAPVTIRNERNEVIGSGPAQVTYQTQQAEQRIAQAQAAMQSATNQLVNTVNGPPSSPQDAVSRFRQANDAADAARRQYEQTASGFQCVAMFAVSVPEARFYQIQVGTHSGPSYSFDDLRTADFKLDLSLGH